MINPSSQNIIPERFDMEEKKKTLINLLNFTKKEQIYKEQQELDLKQKSNEQPFLFLIPISGEIITDFVFKTNKKQILIGLDEQCDLILMHQKIDQQHAKIIYDEEDKSYAIFDLGSKHGTYIQINEEAQLELGDLIEFGSSLFEVKDISVNEKILYLQSLKGDYKNELLIIRFFSNEIKIGRSQKCEIHLKNQEISSEHAVFTLNENGILLNDLESQNGTWMRLSKNKIQSAEYCLSSDQTIRFCREQAFLINLLNEQEANTCSHCQTRDPDTMVTPCLDLLCEKCLNQSPKKCITCAKAIEEVFKIQNL